MRSTVNAAVTASGDTNTFVLDAGTEFQRGLDGTSVVNNTNNIKSNDTVHPYGSISMAFGGILAQQAQSKLATGAYLGRRPIQ